MALEVEPSKGGEGKERRSNLILWEGLNSSELHSELAYSCSTWWGGIFFIFFPCQYSIDLFLLFSPSFSISFLAINSPKDEASITSHGRLFHIKMFLPIPVWASTHALLLPPGKLLLSCCLSITTICSQADFHPCHCLFSTVNLCSGALPAVPTHRSVFLPPKLCFQA